MEFIPIIFNTTILSVILYFTWKTAMGSFVEKRDVQKIVNDYLANTYVFDTQKLLDDTNRNYEKICFNVGVIERTIDELLTEPVPTPVQQESPTLQAIESGSRIATDAFSLGCKSILEALTRDGRIAGEQVSAINDEAVNIGEEDYEIPSEDPALPGIIVARNAKAAGQIGDKINDDLMKFMDEKI